MTASRLKEDDWLSELERLSSEHPDGFTTYELAESKGLTVECARRKIAEGKRAGLIRFAGKRPSTGIDERTTQVPVYQAVGQKKQGRKRARR